MPVLFSESVGGRMRCGHPAPSQLHCHCDAFPGQVRIAIDAREVQITKHVAGSGTGSVRFVGSRVAMPSNADFAARDSVFRFLPLAPWRPRTEINFCCCRSRRQTLICNAARVGIPETCDLRLCAPPTQSYTLVHPCSITCEIASDRACLQAA